jgi:hypothetical protein
VLEPRALPGSGGDEGLDALRAALSVEERWKLEAALGAAASRAATREVAASQAEMDAVVRQWSAKAAQDRSGAGTKSATGMPGHEHTWPPGP